MTHKTVRLLLIEDDAVDVMSVKRAFQQERIVNPIHVAKDGVEALDMLRGENGHEKVPRPYVVMLDLNMPRMGGLEFLTEIRADAQLKDSLVFVLTTSGNESDKQAAYGLNIAGYLVKSEVGPGFLKAIALLDHYWRVVEFP